MQNPISAREALNILQRGSDSGEMPERDALSVGEYFVRAAFLALKARGGSATQTEARAAIGAAARELMADLPPAKSDELMSFLMSLGEIASPSDVQSALRWSADAPRRWPAQEGPAPGDLTRPFTPAAPANASVALPHAMFNGYGGKMTPMAMAIAIHRNLQGFPHAREKAIEEYVANGEHLRALLGGTNPGDIYDALAQVCDAMMGDIATISSAASGAMPGCLSFSVWGTRLSWAEFSPELVVVVRGHVPEMPWAGLEVPHYVVVDTAEQGHPNGIPLQWGLICSPGTPGARSSAAYWSATSRRMKEKPICFVPQTSRWPFNAQGKKLMLKSVAQLPLGMTMDNLQGAMAHEVIKVTTAAANSGTDKRTLSHAT